MTKKKKTIMRSLKIDEISGVDRPAQEGATVAILKRDDNEPDEIEKRLRLTTSNKGHTHLAGSVFDMIEGGGHTSYELSDGGLYSHSHPYEIADDGTINIGRAEGHTHSMPAAKMWVEVEQEWIDDQVSRLVKYLKPVGESGGGLESETGEPQMTDKKAAEDITKAEQERDEAREKLAKAEALAEMTDVQKDHYGSLDADEQTAFLGKSADERQKDVVEAQKADKVVYTDAGGNEYRKSDDQRLVEAVKRADKAAEKAEQRERVAKAAGLAKRVKDEMAHYPGETEDKVELLKAVDTIEDEAVRGKISKMLIAGETALVKAFMVVGTQDTAGFGKTDAESRLDAMAKGLQEKDPNLTYEAAYVKATETNEGSQLYAETLTNLG